MRIKIESTVEGDSTSARWRMRLQVNVDVHQLVRIMRMLAAVGVTALLAGCG